MNFSKNADPGNDRGRFDTAKAQYQTLNLTSVGVMQNRSIGVTTISLSSAAAATAVSEILGGSRP